MTCINKIAVITLGFSLAGAHCLILCKAFQEKEIARFTNLDGDREITLNAYYQVTAPAGKLGMSAPHKITASALPNKKEVDFVFLDPETGGTLQRVEVLYPEGNPLVIDKPEAGQEYRIQYEEKEYTERKLKD